MSVEVLKGFRYILSLVALDNVAFVRIGYFHIPSAILRFAYMIPMNISMLLIIWYSFDYGFDLKMVSGAFSLILGITQIDLIYLTLAMKTALIKDIVDYFRNVVQRSNFNLI